MKFPLIAFKNNIVFNDHGEAFATYRLRGEAYNYLPKAEREMVMRRLEQFLFGFEGRGMILLLNEELRMDEAGYLAAAGVSRSLSPDMTQEAIRHARSVRGALAAGAILRCNCAWGVTMNGWRCFRSSGIPLWEPFSVQKGCY